MPGFSIARVPYYIAVIVYMGFVAFVAYVGNTVSTGVASDFYLAILLLAAVLAGLSVMYVLHAKAGGDDEVDTEVAGLPVAKNWYYLGVLAMAAFHGFEGYKLNHDTTGISSTYGILWLLASLALALLTWANYRSYRAKRAPAAQVRPR